MTKWACLIGLVLLAPAATFAQSVSVHFDGGYVTVSARNAPVREILGEWARQGKTKVVNAEKIPGGLVTIELNRVPEKQALEVLLRSAAGYMAAPRSAGTVGPSAYDRILIMATTSPAGPPIAGGGMGPRAMPAPPPAFVPPGQPPITIEDQDDEAPPVTLGGPGAIVSEPGDEGEDLIQPPFPGPPQGVGPDGQPVQGDPNAPPAPPPVVPGPTPLPQGVITQPMPGQIPVPQQQPKP
jgi:hypothetical protein